MEKLRPLAPRAAHTFSNMPSPATTEKGTMKTMTRTEGRELSLWSIHLKHKGKLCTPRTKAEGLGTSVISGSCYQGNSQCWASAVCGMLLHKLKHLTGQSHKGTGTKHMSTKHRVARTLPPRSSGPFQSYLWHFDVFSWLVLHNALFSSVGAAVPTTKVINKKPASWNPTCFTLHAKNATSC